MMDSVNYRDTTSLYPTLSEINTWLDNNSFTNLLKERLWTTDRIEDAIFITKDGELIDWSKWKDLYLPVWSWMGNTNVMMEHYTAVDALLFWNWTRVWREGERSMAAQNILPIIQDREGLVRVRFFDSDSVWWTYDFNIIPPHNNITSSQESVIQRYIDEIYDKTAYEWKTYRINIEWTETPWWWWTITTSWRNFVDIKEVKNKIRDVKSNFKYPADNEVRAENKKMLDREYKYISSLDKPFDDLWRKHDLSFMLQSDKYMDELDTADASMKVKLFTDWRTMKEIADYYNIPVEILEWVDLINWVKAWWAF